MVVVEPLKSAHCYPSALFITRLILLGIFLADIWIFCGTTEVAAKKMSKISLAFFTLALASSVDKGYFFTLETPVMFHSYGYNGVKQVFENKVGLVQKPGTADKSLNAHANDTAENAVFVDRGFDKFTTVQAVREAPLEHSDSLHRLEKQVRSLESWRSKMDDTYKRQSQRLENLHMQFEIIKQGQLDVSKCLRLVWLAKFRNPEITTNGEQGPDKGIERSLDDLNHSKVASSAELKSYFRSRYLKDFTKPPFLEEEYSGDSTDKSTAESAEPKISEVPDLCGNASINSITTTRDGSTYVFKGNFYWKLNPDGNQIECGYPRIISEDWDGLRGFIDASLTWQYGTTVFFKDRQYWKFTDMFMHPGYPKLISEGFKGIPDYLDAAVVVQDNPNAYFFKGRKYWRYDTDIRGVRPEYPKDIGLFWTGLPDDMDAAFRNRENKSYFFKGQIYYRIDRTYGVDPIDFGGGKRYPLSIAEEWFGCAKRV